MALPLSRACVTASQSRRRAIGSMPVDGSSSKMTAGFPIRAIAVLSIRLLPPLHRRRENAGKGEDIQISYLQDSVSTNVSNAESQQALNMDIRNAG